MPACLSASEAEAANGRPLDLALLSEFEPKVLLGAALCFSSTLLISITTNVQKRAHARIALEKAAASDAEADAEGEGGGKRRSGRVLCDPGWLAAFVVFLLANVGDAAALALLPQVVFSLVSSLSIPLNLLFAWVINREASSPTTVAGALQIFLGVAVAFALSPRSPRCYAPRELDGLIWAPVAVATLILKAALAFALLLIGERVVCKMNRQGSQLLLNPIASVTSRERVTLKTCLVASSAILGSFTVTSIKIAGEIVEHSVELGGGSGGEDGTSAGFGLGSPVTIVLALALGATVFFSMGQIYLFQLALSWFSASFVTNYFWAIFFLANVATSILVWREFDGLDPRRGLGFSAGCFMALIGAVSLSIGDERSEAETFRGHRIRAEASEALEEPTPASPQTRSSDEEEQHSTSTRAEGGDVELAVDARSAVKHEQGGDGDGRGRAKVRLGRSFSL